MTSSIINFIVERYLANILEINTSQTNASIWSGLVEMNNVKIKPEIFQTLNLPYLKLINGYIGKLKLQLQMPRFYLYPIQVHIEKIFFHACQKNVDKLDKQTEINGMEYYKTSKLLTQEQLIDQLNQLKSENVGYFQQIMNNIQITIEDIVFRYDDDVSFPKIPYSLGIILNKMFIRTTRDDFILPEDEYEQIPYAEINYKLIQIKNFSIFMDCYNNHDDLKYDNLIETDVKNNIPHDIQNYLGNILNFYSYCLSEIEIHSKDKVSHQYLLHQFDMDLKISLNDNLDNQQPKYSASLIFPEINFCLTLKQTQTLFKVMAYINLNSYYQLGIANDYYTKQITQEEKDKYIQDYLKYYKDKYVSKLNINFPEELSKFETGLTYETIQNLRNQVYNKLQFMSELGQIENELKTEEGKWFYRDNEKIEKLKKKLEDLKNKESKLDNLPNDELNKKGSVEIDPYYNLPDNFVLYHVDLVIIKHNFIIYEDMELNKEKNNWKPQGELIKFVNEEFIIKADARKTGQLFIMSLKNVIFSQDKVKNPNYNKILFGDEQFNTDEKILYIEFENNPAFEKSNYRLLMKTERRVYLIINLYSIKYIINKIVSAMSQSINFSEIKSYAQDSVSKYIQSGYASKFFKSGDYQHFNIDININFKSPIIIIPQNIMNYHCKKCIYFETGEMNITTKLPPRQNLDIDYKTLKDEELMFDNYIIDLKGVKMSTMDNCIKSNGYKGIEEIMVKDFNLNIEYKMILNSENPNFDNAICTLNIPILDFKITEFQINFLLYYLKCMYLENGILNKEIEDDNKRLGISNKFNEIDEIKNFISEQAKKVIKTEENQNEEIKENNNENLNKKKSLQYNNLVKNFANAGKKSNEKIPSLFDLFKEKKNFHFKFNIYKVKYSFIKNYPNNKQYEYLIFEQNKLTILFDNTVNSNMIFSLIILNVNLYDKEIDLKGNKIVHKQYECLIENVKKEDDKKNKSFIDITFYYVNKFSLSNTIMIMNNLNIIASFDSFKRMYQFFMYYWGEYKEMTAEVQKINQSKIDKEEYIKNLIKEDKQNGDAINKNFFEKVKKIYEGSRIITEEIDKIKDKNKLNKKKSKNELILEEIKKEKLEDKLIKTDKIKSDFQITFYMNNTVLKMPLDSTSIDSPVFTLNFNMSYIQKWKQEYTETKLLPSLTPIKQDYTVYDSSMNFIIYNAEFDMVYFIEKLNKFTNNLTTEKLISNFRFVSQIKSFIVPKDEIYIYNIDCLFEPLLINFGFRQLKKINEYYNQSMKFLYTDMREKYVPYIYPSNENKIYDEFDEEANNDVADKFNKINNINKTVNLLSNVKTIEDKKKYYRLRLKKIIKKIIFNSKIKRHFSSRYKTISKKLKKEDIRNISHFNTYMNINLKLDKCSITVFDNTQIQKRLLLDIEITKTYMRYLTNSIIKDKTNMGNALIEIITGNQIPIEQFNIQNLYYYMLCNFCLEVYYYNSNLSEFEPFIEPFNMKAEIAQVAKMLPKKLIVESNDMFDINISATSIKVLNLFLLRYYEDEKKWGKPKYFRKEQLKSREDEKREKDEIILQFKNMSGVSIKFWFDSNPGSKFKINDEETISFTKNNLYDAQNIQKNGMNNRILKNKFSFNILESDDVNSIDFKVSNYCQFNTNLNINGEKKYIEFNVKVNTNSLIKEIIFDSSITIINQTIYDKIIISINDESIKKNKIIINKNLRGKIPISWMISTNPNPYVTLQIEENSEKIKIYDNINEIIVNEKDENQLDEIKKNKDKLEKLFKNWKNPLILQNLNNLKDETENNKNSKIINIINNKEINYLTLDYLALQSTSTKKIKEKLKEEIPIIDDVLSNNKNDNFTENRVNKNNIKDLKIFPSYEYYIIIRPLIIFENLSPFNININLKGLNINLEPLKSENIYNISSYEQNLEFSLQLNYYDNIYKSEVINFSDIPEFLKLEYNNEELYIHCFKTQQDKYDRYNQFILKIEQYSTLSYKYKFYFDYIITNRLKSDLICQFTNEKKYDKKNKNPIIKLKSEKINLISSYFFDENNFYNKMILKTEQTDWSKSFEIHTIGLEGVVKLENLSDEEIISTNKKNNIKIYTDIACLIKNSIKYQYSLILIFEQRYLLVNNLGIDIYYKQEEDKENTEYFCKKDNEQEILYKSEKRHYRIGIKSSNNIMNWSTLFDCENIEDFDLMIKIEKCDIEKYKTNLYSLDGINYHLMIRVINKTYDNGIIYIMLVLPQYPYLQIDNQTSQNLIIKESNDKKEVPLKIAPMKKVPFVWKNTLEIKNTLAVEIYNKSVSFSFSKFDKNIIEIKTIDENNLEVDKIISFSVSTKNRNYTRCLTVQELKEKEGELTTVEKIFYREKKRPTTYKYNISMKGIGLSLIDDIPKEIFYISFYGIKIIYTNNILNLNNNAKTENTQNLIFYLKNFQIDYCLNDSLKNIIFPKNQIIPSNESKENNNEEIVPFISLLIETQNTKNIINDEILTKYPQIDFTMQEFDIKIEQYAIENLLNLSNNYIQLLDYNKNDDKKEESKEEEFQKIKIKAPIQDLKRENENTKMMLINYLLLGAIKFNFTLRLDFTNISTNIMPKTLIRILGAIGNSFTRISETPLKFSEKIFENIYIDIPNLISKLSSHYTKQGIFQIYKILGSSDLIGNPVKLIDNIGTGFFELINEPRKGFLQGPSQFGKGLARGIAGLISGVVGGAFDSVGKITGTLYAATQQMTGKSREIIIDEEDEPENILSGTAEGLLGVGKELAKGFTGVFLNPYRKAKQQGVKGFFKGLGSGLLGLIISPFAAVFKLVNSIAVGMKNTVKLLTKTQIKTERFRHPRVIIEGETIKAYDNDLAEAKELLYKILKIETNNIIFNKDFICGEKEYSEKASTIILTDEYLVVIYNNEKIIFNINVRTIKKCALHYLNDLYIIVFELDNMNHRGFNCKFEYSDVLCKLYDIISEMTNAKKEKHNVIFTAEDLKNSNDKKLNKFYSAHSNIIENNNLQNESNKNNNSGNLTLQKTINNNNSIYQDNINSLIDEKSNNSNDDEHYSDAQSNINSSKLNE